LGSGAILRATLEAQQLLADKYGIGSDVYSVTSYSQLARDAQACDHWNRLHPTDKPKKSYLEQLVGDREGPFIASSDYVRAVSMQISPWLPGGLYALGTDGLGRSETREELRRHFEVDAASIVVATMYQLSQRGQAKASDVQQAIGDLDVDPDKIDPMYA
jgi:pyruvate dehydrogenase E1 component